jgi:LPXTG-motif cell wall-anchored protein
VIIRLLSMTPLRRKAARPEQSAGGGLSRSLVATTPPRRRSAVLLLTLSLAFLACVLLGFVGSRTALAQAGETKEAEQKPPPKDQQQQEQQNQELQKQTPYLAGTCVSTDSERSITLQGTGWTPGTPINFYQNGVFLNAKSPDANGNITQRYDSPSYVPGTTVTMEARQPTIGINAGTTVTCPQPPAGGTTTPSPGGGTAPAIAATCDLVEDPNNPAQVVISWEGRRWRPGEVVYISVRGADEPPTAAEQLDMGTPGADGVVAGSSVYSGGKQNLILEAQAVYLYLGGSPIVASIQCPPPPGGGGTTGGGTTGGGTSGGETTGGGTTGGGGSGEEGSDGGSSSSGGGVVATAGSVFSGLVAGQLPDTGGGWATLLIAGAILIALGWLLVRLARRLAAAR